MASITRTLKSANDLMLCVPTFELLNRDLERSMNLAIDFNQMLSSSYVGDWPMISFVIA